MTTEIQQCYQGDLKELVYQFFFKFSRFEFALKKSGYVRSGHRDVAQPDWTMFYREYQDDYIIDDRERELLEAPPKVQVYRNNRILWEDIRLNAYRSDLAKLTIALRAMRNNLFHGGKHGHQSWDDRDRVSYLLERGIHCLDKFSDLKEELTTHYTGSYS